MERGYFLIWNSCHQAAISIKALVYGAFKSTLFKLFVKTSSVSTMQWTMQERAFAVEAYFSFSHSIIATQRAFRKHFNIAPAGRVPNRKSVCLWVDIFKDTRMCRRKVMDFPELKTLKWQGRRFWNPLNHLHANI